MVEETENGKKTDEGQSRREPLAKSKALKEKAVLLKAQMNATAKACDDFLHHDKQRETE